MKRLTCTSLIAIALIALTFVGAPRASAGGTPRLVVVVSAGTALRDIPLATLRRVFKGDLAVVDGVHLVPFNYAPSDPIRVEFDHVALGMNADQVGRYWIDRRIRGQGMPPRTAPSPTVLKAVVAKLAGAIGYIPAQQLDASVRALTIDGKPYDAGGYPLTP